MAANARRLREARGWTQAEAASKSGLDDRAYREVESGRANLTLGTLLRVAKAYDDDVASLLAPAAPWARRRPGRPLDPLPAVPTVKANPPPQVASEPVAGVQGPVAGDAEAFERLPEEQLLEKRAAFLTNLERIDAALRQRGVAPVASGDEVGGRGRPSVVVPSGRWLGLKDFAVALLLANPRGLQAFELVEAARRAKIKLRDNEVHTVLHGLLRRRAISREGRAGAFIYRLCPPDAGEAGA
ncbi:MAG: helix-turn-helix transcriptional regulator [Polyangiales bacterium]